MSETSKRTLALARIASAALAAIERVDAGADTGFAIDFIRRALAADALAAFDVEYRIPDTTRKGDA